MGKKKRSPEVDSVAEPPPLPAASWRSDLAIFAAGLALRLIHLLLYRDDFWLKTPLLDDSLFVAWAGTIAKEGWLARSLGMFDFNPGYPYFLALLQRLTGDSVLSVIAVQHLAGALAPVALFRLTLRAFGRGAAWVAAGIGVLYGPVFFYESRLLGEFWIFLFNLAALLAMLRAARQGAPSLKAQAVLLPPERALRSGRPWIFWGAAGLALGASTVLRPNVLVFVPLAAAWCVASLRRSPASLAACLLAFAAGVWLPLLPFQLRNRAVDPSAGWGLTTTSGGVNLYLGNNPEADGLNQAPSFVRYGPGHQYDDFRDEAQRRLGRPLSRPEVSRYWTRESWRWVSSRPGAAWRLFTRKCGFFWNYREPPDNFFPEIFDRFTALGKVPLLGWGFVAPLGLAGLLWSLRRREDREPWLLHAYVAAYFLVNAAFYILSRYRFPAVAALIPFAAFALARLRESWQRGARGSAAGLAAVMLLCLGLSRIPLIGDEDKAVSRYSMGVIYANQGWKDKAVEQYRAAIAENSDFKAPYLNLGILQVEMGRIPEGIAALEGALRLETDPRQAQLIRDNLARLRQTPAR